MSIIFGIDYDDAHQDSYKAITVHMPDDSEKRFDSGNPTEDHRAAIRSVRSYLERGFSLLGSSSMDHFVMDGDNWTYAIDPVLAKEGIDAEILMPHVRITSLTTSPELIQVTHTDTDSVRLTNLSLAVADALYKLDNYPLSNEIYDIWLELDKSYKQWGRQD